MTQKLKENEYKCANCGKIFESAWSNEEAQKEADGLWKKEDLQKGTVVVCDTCFKKLMRHKKEYDKKNL